MVWAMTATNLKSSGQAFLYKFLNDKYDFEVKQIRKEKPNEANRIRQYGY